MRSRLHCPSDGATIPCSPEAPALLSGAAGTAASSATAKALAFARVATLQCCCIGDTHTPAPSSRATRMASSAPGSGAPTAAREDAAAAACAPPSFELFLLSSGSVFAVLSREDATVLYISPNLDRVFNRPASRVLGCARSACARALASRKPWPAAARLPFCAASRLRRRLTCERARARVPWLCASGPRCRPRAAPRTGRLWRRCCSQCVSRRHTPRPRPRACAAAWRTTAPTTRSCGES